MKNDLKTSLDSYAITVALIKLFALDKNFAGLLMFGDPQSDRDYYTKMALSS